MSSQAEVALLKVQLKEYESAFGNYKSMVTALLLDLKVIAEESGADEVVEYIIENGFGGEDE
jgi:hypothetical protein